MSDNFPIQSYKCFDRLLCIICQKDSDLILTAYGCAQIRNAATLGCTIENKILFEDEVYNRVIQLGKDELFYYHMSDSCYKKFCNKKNISIAQKKLRQNVANVNSKNETGNEVLECSKQRVTRSKINNVTIIVRKNLCIICGND